MRARRTRPFFLASFPSACYVGYTYKKNVFKHPRGQGAVDCYHGIVVGEVYSGKNGKSPRDLITITEKDFELVTLIGSGFSSRVSVVPNSCSCFSRNGYQSEN